jgi:histidinol-phosphate aminotransferase
MPAVTAYPSDANFILFRVAGAPRVFDGLKQHGVLVKNLHGSHPLLADCLRVTVGAPAENARFLQALAALC